MHVKKQLLVSLLGLDTLFAMSLEIEHERNYAMNDLDLAAIIHALKI
jgi:hypothetical protein